MRLAISLKSSDIAASGYPQPFAWPAGPENERGRRRGDERYRRRAACQQDKRLVRVHFASRLSCAAPCQPGANADEYVGQAHSPPPNPAMAKDDERFPRRSVSRKGVGACLFTEKGGAVAIGLQKLSAGSGYEYLTRQVAAMDATGRAHTTLADSSTASRTGGSSRSIPRSAS